MDGHGRKIGDVRVSVTDRCNFRCQYCMPADGLPWLEREAILTFAEIERVVALLADMGVGDVRLTGGEPLVRRDFPVLAGLLAAVPGVDDLSVTTNGFLLERDAAALVAAGIDRFNVSVDSLQRDRFFEMTRRDALPQVLRGLEVLGSFPEAHPIKVNAVIWYRILDPARAVMEVKGVGNAVIQVALTTLRAVLGRHSLDELLKDQETTARSLQTGIDIITEPWGVQVERVEMKNVEIPRIKMRLIRPERETWIPGRVSSASSSVVTPVASKSASVRTDATAGASEIGWVDPTATDTT